MDGFRGRSQTPLENGQGKPDGPGPFTIFKGFGPVELFADIVGDGFVQPCFFKGEFIGNRIGNPFRKQWGSVKFEQVFLDHAAHEIGDVNRMDPIPEAALKPVPVQEGHEQLEIRFLAVVRGGGHEQEMPGQGG